MKNQDPKSSSPPLIFTLISLLLLTIFVTILLLIQPVAATEQPPTQTLDLSDQLPNCRIGVPSMGTAHFNKLAQLGVGWHLNFTVNGIDNGEIEYLPTVRLKQVKDGDTYLDQYTTTPLLNDAGLGARISALPGATWIIGNEPDRGPSPGGGGAQDDMQPEMYARAYHDVYTYIKNRDPQAKVAIAGLVQITPGRLQYLDKVWAEYNRLYRQQMPVDVWNMHLYILPEVNSSGVANGIASVAVGTNPALGMKESDGNSSLCGQLNNQVYCYADHDNLNFFKQQIVAMRTWMKAHGQQHKPLLLSEFSLLYPYDDTNNDGAEDFLRDEFGNLFAPARVSSFLRQSFDYLDGGNVDYNLGYPQDNYRLVQQSLWFSMYYNGAGRASNLFTDEAVTTLSPVGLAFLDEMTQRVNQGIKPNLKPGGAIDTSAFIIAPGTTATATLSVDVYNNGDTPAGEPFTITFYSDQALSNAIGSAVLPDIGGCARGPIRVGVDWPGLTAGVHRFWVKVDSGTAVTESNENDNVISGLVIVNPKQVFLPLVSKS